MRAHAVGLATGCIRPGRLNMTSSAFTALKKWPSVLSNDSPIAGVAMISTQQKPVFRYAGPQYQTGLGRTSSYQAGMIHLFGDQGSSLLPLRMLSATERQRGDPCPQALSLDTRSEALTHHWSHRNAHEHATTELQTAFAWALPANEYSQNDARTVTSSSVCCAICARAMIGHRL